MAALEETLAAVFCAASRKADRCLVPDVVFTIALAQTVTLI